METYVKPAGRFDPSSPMGSRKWWDYQLAHCWEKNGGPAQTSYFMSALIDHLPLSERSYLRDNSLSIIDCGCAMGEGVVTLSRAFPLCRVAGLDVAQSAIEAAQAHYPQYEFILSEEGEIPRLFDVVLTSNVLEHFEDPFTVARRQAASSRLLYLILVPYSESPPMDGHLVAFTEESFPIFLGGLVRVSVLPFKTNPKFWYGMQVLVVYASQTYLQLRRRDEEAVSTGMEQDWEIYFQSPPRSRALLEALAIRCARVETALNGAGATLARPEPPTNLWPTMEKVEKLERLRERWAPCDTWRRKLLNRFMARLLDQGPGAD